jgi:hypothetical protein
MKCKMKPTPDEAHKCEEILKISLTELSGMHGYKLYKLWFS